MENTTSTSLPSAGLSLGSLVAEGSDIRKLLSCGSDDVVQDTFVRIHSCTWLGQVASTWDSVYLEHPISQRSSCISGFQTQTQILYAHAVLVLTRWARFLRVTRALLGTFFLRPGRRAVFDAMASLHETKRMSQEDALLAPHVALV